MRKVKMENTKNGSMGKGAGFEVWDVNVIMWMRARDLREGFY